MIHVYMMGDTGTTMGITRMIAAIGLFRNQLVTVIRIKNDTRYTFIAIFRDSVGVFTALINQWGATSGYNGSGPYAHAQLLTCLDEQSIALEEADWRDWQTDYPEFTTRLDALDQDDAAIYTGAFVRLWSVFLTSYIWHFLPDTQIRPSDDRLQEVGYIKG